MFVSVNGKAREVVEIFAGGADGLAHKISEAFGSVDGIAKLIYTSVKHAPNAFDKFTWAQIKDLADAGQLLEHFNKGDLVEIKFKEPVFYTDGSGNILWYQDAMMMQVAELEETGMKLVAYSAVPYSFTLTFDGTVFQHDVESSSSYWDRTLDYAYWGLCKSLYNGCKAIDNALPDDLRDVLFDYAPCYKWEYYIDDEGKERFRKEYDDCRVRQISDCGYEYHKEFIEERNRYEYVLDFSYFPRTKSAFQKYIPLENRIITAFSHAYGIHSFRYDSPNVTTRPVWRYTMYFNDPKIAWNWDWENYDNWNQLDSIDKKTFSKYTYTDGSALIPEMQIGVLSNQK
jgi:hypothetical protein